MKRLSYADIVASLALILLLSTATAFAATQLAKNSVGSKQLKKNSVTAAKIKKNAVTGAKIKKDAVTTAKIANAAVTGPKFDTASAPFQQTTALISGAKQVSFAGGLSVYPFAVPSYVQKAGETNQYIASYDVHYPASCPAPRTSAVYLMVDAPNPGIPIPTYTSGYGISIDEAGGDKTERVSFVPFPSPGSPPLTKFAAKADTIHIFSMLLAGSSCSEATVTGARIQILGVK